MKFAGNRIPFAQGQRLGRVFIQSQLGAEEEEGEGVGGDHVTSYELRIGMDGFGKRQRVDAGGFVFEEDFGDFFERRA